MNHKDKKFEEMKQAAREAGIMDPSGSQSAGLEQLWSELESVMEPPQSNQPESSFKNIGGFGPVRPTLASRFRHLPVWATGMGIAALLAFGFLLVQSTRLHTTLDQMEAQVNHLESSLILASLRSESAVDRMEGLLKMAGSRHNEPTLVSAVVDRLEYDPITNVRLAAVKTLGLHADQPQVLDTLESVARTEESPLVVLEILEILWAHDTARAEKLWIEIRGDQRFAGTMVPDTPAQETTSTTNL